MKSLTLFSNFESKKCSPLAFDSFTIQQIQIKANMEQYVHEVLLI